MVGHPRPGDRGNSSTFKSVTIAIDDLGAFTTPTLRNVALTAPHMHDDGVETIEDAVVHDLNGGVTEAGLDDPRMVAMEAYAHSERRGVPLDSGKH